MLKPGQNGWDLYGELVAQAYEKAPSFDPDAVSAFKALEPFVIKMFNQIQSRVSVQYVDEDPYPSEIEMCRDAMQNGVLKIWKGGLRVLRYIKQPISYYIEPIGISIDMIYD